MNYYSSEAIIHATSAPRCIQDKYLKHGYYKKLKQIKIPFIIPIPGPVRGIQPGPYTHSC